ncbi:DUF4199 domain-containing protein [Spirosoma aerolatum]|uniref:DUF4199 domain-containing protein n=1 Tax=Spirosoma aerolatum TaxID=1211326 RepID=UPI0009AF157A|nr:DUF4199 domain-containing protein [Spirosoma aerolatum]
MEEKTSTTRVALKWALILAVVSIIYSIILFVTDSIGNRALGFVAYGLTIAAIIMAMREFRTLNGGFMTYGEGVGLGTLTAAISGFISSLFSVFYMTVIDTGIMTRAADKAREQMENQGMPDEQIDSAMSIMEKFQSPGILFAFGVIGSIFLGLIFSLIIAAFIRRNKNNPFE